MVLINWLESWDPFTVSVALLIVLILPALVLLWRRGWSERVRLLGEDLHSARLQLAQASERLKYLERAETRIDMLEFEQGSLREQLAVRQAQVAELEARLQAEREAHDEKLLALNQAQEQLEGAFQNLANRIFEEKSRRFAENNQQTLSTLLGPLRQQLGDFKQRVEDVYDREAKDRRALHTEISQLKQLNTQMSQDAVNLTRALKGDTRLQGSWGEVILARALENAGLREGREYFSQKTYQQADKRYRPDVVVQLPDNKVVIVDAKVSLKAYERYCASEDSEIQHKALQAHVLSLRNHINGLAAKAYHELESGQSLDFVLLFIPIEGAFLLALEQDAGLVTYGLEKQVMLVGPATLLVTLRTIQYAWRHEYQSKNAQEIARRGGELYDKLIGFTESLQDVGSHLEKARHSYDQAHKRLSQGRGNLLQQAVQLQELGVSGKKSLPADLAKESTETEQ